MKNIGKRICQTQVSLKINALSQKKGLLFQDAFDSKKLTATLFKFFPKFRNRAYGPITTLFAFLSQVLSSDASCKDAVARVNSERIARGEKLLSPDTGAYCKARDRLSEAWIHELSQDCGKSMEEKVPEQWLWKDRHLKGVDGSTVLMADTPENQASYPCKTPERVRKHIRATTLAYNLIRKLIAESAHRYDLLPTELSFKSAVQTLNQYRPLWTKCHPQSARRVLDLLLDAISKSRVGNRPNRIEPRLVKRRPKPFTRLTVPRPQARAKLVK